ncbi:MULTISPECIES: hypothetical protein [unclassified Nocardia]|uniref:hypothetical protein n=1 Tax=unclassified Nocardia TaxID=2637762 RepID=UPI001CE4AD79|nr:MULTISPECIES: hypothetical protein [unclassified Nocardia]
MIAGVVRETAKAERRVALTPDGVRRLVAAGHRIMVEYDAGRGVEIADTEYRTAGADLVDRAELYGASDLVAWVKPPAYQLDSLVRPGMTLVGFQDPIHRAALIDELRARGVTSVGFEAVTHDRPEIDALSAMSRIAGEIAYGQARQLVSGSDPMRALIIGCGQAGLSAIGTAVRSGDAAVAIGNRPEQADAAIHLGAKRFLANPDGDPEVLRRQLAAEPPALVFCAAVHRGSKGPILIDAATLDAMAVGTVIVDLVGKSGGNCVATVPDRTVTLPNGVIVTHRSNYPADRPSAASAAYSAAMTAMILELDRRAAIE